MKKCEGLPKLSAEQKLKLKMKVISTTWNYVFPMNLHAINYWM